LGREGKGVKEGDGKGGVKGRGKRDGEWVEG